MSHVSASRLPPTWAECDLGSCASTITKGSTPTSYGHSYKTAGIRFVRVENLSGGSIDRESISVFIDEAADETLRRSRLQAGDVLFSIAGTIGRTAVVREHDLPANTNQAVAIVRGTDEVFTSPFLQLALSSAIAQDQARTEARGGAMQNVSLADVRAIRLPVPPLAEQHRIVAAIETHVTRLDAAVAALQRARANLMRYRAAVLTAAVEGRLVPAEADLGGGEDHEYEPASVLLGNARMRKGSARLFETSDTPEIRLRQLPPGWAWTTVGQISEIQGGIQKQPKRTPRSNAYPFLRVANVLRGRLDLREVHDIELFGDELSRLRLQRGDLLIVEGNGSPSEIGRMAVWNGSIENCVHQNHIIRVRPTAGLIPEYVQAYWNSPEGTHQVTEVASSTSGLYTLSVSKVSRLPVPIPPTAEQVRIVAEIDRRFSAIEELESAVDHGLKRADRARQSILKHAFEGKLVPQDPDDEPAAVILEHIQVERAGAVDGRRGPARTGNGRLRGRGAGKQPDGVTLRLF